MQTVKRCKNCHVEKPFEEFHKEPRNKDGCTGKCKSCMSDQSRQWRDANRDSLLASKRAYHAEHADEINAKRRDERADDGDGVRAVARAHYARNAEREAARQLAYHHAHVEHISEQRRERYANDIERQRQIERDRLPRRREQLREWRTQNKEHLRDYQRRYVEQHREALWEARVAWKAANQELLSAEKTAWLERHPGYMAAAVAKRRALKKHAPIVERIDRNQIIERDRSTCYLCARHLERSEITLDHVIPLTRGGSHTHANLKVACRSCNSAKGNRTLEEFHARRGIRIIRAIA